MDSAADFERVRKANMEAMEARVLEADRIIRELYPMSLDNPCLKMSESQFLAYIRKCRGDSEA